MAKKKIQKDKSKEVKDTNRFYFTREQLLQFCDMDVKEAGEFIIDIARFIEDGVCPVMKDRYKARYFKSMFGDSIARQMKVYDFRVEQCIENAENRKRANSEEEDSVEEGNDVAVADSNVTVSGSNVTVSGSNVTELPDIDISYANFKKLYGKEDMNGYNTEAKWNSHSDDDKRKMIFCIQEKINGKIDVSKRMFPSAFINGNSWK